MKKIKSLVALASIFTAANAIAGGLTASGKISLLSHEVSGSYVQILDAASTVINTDPDTCGGADMYFLPLDHANYTVLSSSLLTAEMTQRELAFHVEGCENGMAKIAFVRFGNWDGVVLNSPTTPPSTPPATGNGGNGSQRFTTTGVTDAQATFQVPDSVNIVYVTMCGGGGAGGIRDLGYGGAGSTAIVKSPYLVSPGESIDIAIGGGGSGDFFCESRCSTGGDSKFGTLIAPGAKNASRMGQWVSSPIEPPNFRGGNQYFVEGGAPGGNGVMDGESVNGNTGGKGVVHSAYGRTHKLAGGGASIFGPGADGQDGTSFDSWGRVSGNHASGYCAGGGVGMDFGGSGGPGIVIVEW